MRTLSALLLTIAMLHPIQARPNEYVGFAARYRKGLMARVASNRGIAHQRCMIAATHEPLRSWVRVTSLTTGAVLDCLVVDIPHPRDRKEVIRRGIIAEVAFENAIEVCGSTRQRPQDCQVRIRRIS